VWLDTLSGDDIGLFYLPVMVFFSDRAQFLTSSDGKSLIPLDSLVTPSHHARARSCVVIDACRNSPFFQDEPHDQIELFEISGQRSTQQLLAVFSSKN
jgi:hypothetical protein